MSQRSQATRAVWLAIFGIGLLFLARGAFLPYFFPIFEHLTRLSYGEISLLLNLYVFSQSVCAPLAGWSDDSKQTAPATQKITILTSDGGIIKGKIPHEAIRDFRQYFSLTLKNSLQN